MIDIKDPRPLRRMIRRHQWRRYGERIALAGIAAGVWALCYWACGG